MELSHSYSVCYTLIVPDRTAILISCLKEEADQIRQRAKGERRPVSSYLLHNVMLCVEFEERLASRLLACQSAINLQLARRPNLPRGHRTTIMLRCSVQDGRRIRSCLRRCWSVSDAYHKRRALERGDVR